MSEPVGHLFHSLPPQSLGVHERAVHVEQDGLERWRGRYPVAATVLAWTVTGLAAVLVLFALLMP
ncbi:hypothetical protein, partial [Streptomyces sp. NPDC005345]|uniref:hypothetical protein n=1 Tax=Streptomyces sp. NPDC005345 TaxID=3156877 RepID=UPI0033AA8768